MALDQYSLLVVDDNENSLDLISRYLQKKGYNVTVVSSGREALAINNIERFDLVLLDIMMPGISGLDVLQKLREKTTTSNIPIIMLTASNDGEHIRKANELYADDFIVKSESLKSIRERVLKVLKNRRIYGQESNKDEKVMDSPDSRILVVDDDELSRELLCRRVNKFGYAAEMAETGEAALEMIDKFHYDLIFLDVHMPNINGIEVLKRIKDKGKLGETAVVMVSANNDIEVIKQCESLGARDYVVKPYHYSLIKNTIKTTFDK